MTDFVAELRLEADADKAVSEIQRETAQLEQLGAAGARAQSGLDQANAASAKLDATVAAATASTTAHVSATTSQAAAQEAAAAAAGVHTTALGALQNWVRQTSQDELLFASAAREAAVAQQAAAAAAVEEAAAYAASTKGAEGHAVALAMVRTAEIELTAATKLATTAKEGEAIALGRVASASTVAGAAAGALRIGATGLVNLLGGPMSIALLAAQGGFMLLSKVMGDSKEKAAALARETAQLDKALELVARLNRDHAITAALASGAIDKQAAAHLRAAAAAEDQAKAQDDLNAKLLRGAYLTAQANVQILERKRFAAQAGTMGPNGEIYAGDHGPDPIGDAELAKARQDANDLAWATLGAGVHAYQKEPKEPKTRTASNKAGNLAGDLAADVIALQAYRAALTQGGVALDEWRIKDAGRQAVERSGLTHKAKTTEAEGALAAKIRESAEAAERLKISTDRVEKAIGLQRSAKLDTEALERRSVAARVSVQALEDLQVKEAGLEAMRSIGIETLDQLTGADRREAEAAIASAQARERQAIATQKATRVGDALRDLDRQITAEKARTAALATGSRTMADYTKAEAMRQAVERAGENLTSAEVEALKEKAAILLQLEGLNDNQDLNRQHEDALLLARLTNQEHELEIRALERAKALRKENLDLTEAEAMARARIIEMRDMNSEEQAAAIGQLREGLKQAFIDSGEIGFDQIADYATKKLREAVYNALLAKPIDMMINAVVTGVSGLSGLAAKLGASGLGAAIGGGGTGVALGQSLGLGTGNSGLDMALGMGASGLASMFAAPISAAVGSAVTSGMAALGASGISSAMAGIGATSLLSSAAVLGPIAAIAVLAAATLFKKKPSNNGAQANLTDDSFSLVGDKRTAETTTMATNAANAVLQGEAMLKAAGITLNATVKSLDLGTRDATDIVLSDGRAFTSAVGDAAAAAETGLKAVLATATYKDDAQKALVEGLVAAGKGFDDIVAALGQLGAAQAIPQAIAEAILKLTDPKGYDVAQLTKSQAARRAEVTAAADAGYLTATQLSAVNEQLTRLEALELDDVMKRFGAATDKAADNLSADINEGFLKILNPAAYQQARGVREINDQIEAMKATAQELIASGQVGADVLGRIDALRDLQLADLAQQVAETTDTFAAARKGLRQWLDALSMSASAELSPVAQRAQALADYQRILGQAKGGDVNAAGQVTTYADRLFAADREATDSAQARLALYNQVRADIEGLAAGGGASANPVAAQLQALGIPLDKLVLTGALTAAANDDIAKAVSPSLAVSVANIPTLKVMYGEVATGQTDRVVAAIETLRTDLKAAIGALATAQGAGSSAAQAALEAALNGVAGGIEYLGGLTAEQTAQLIEMRRTGQIAGAAARFAQVA